jgi:hypothetical protein
MKERMTKSQIAISVAKLIELNPPSIGERRIVIKREAAKNGIGYSSLERGIRVLRFSHPEVLKAVEDGLTNTYFVSSRVLPLPLAEQPAALKKVLLSSEPIRPSQLDTKRPAKLSSKRKWTEAEIAKEKAWLAEIQELSLFPGDAVLPKNGDHDAVEVRDAIEWLRAKEGKISDFKAKELDAMLLRTNRIQAYKVNWGKSPRPEGELDPRIYEWASQLWRKQQRQHDRLNLRRAIRHRHKLCDSPPLIPKAVKTFEKRFETFWMTIEDSLSLFKPKERRKLSGAFRAALINFFSGKAPTPEKLSVSATEDAQEEVLVGEFKAKG